MSLYSSLTQVLAPFAAKINGLLTGYDGTKYATPGEAVRTQISNLHVLIGDEPGVGVSGSAVGYDGTESGLSATNMQGAVDEFLSNTNERLTELGTDIGFDLIKSAEESVGYYLTNNTGRKALDSGAEAYGTTLFGLIPVVPGGTYKLTVGIPQTKNYWFAYGFYTGNGWGSDYFDATTNRIAITEPGELIDGLYTTSVDVTVPEGDTYFAVSYRAFTGGKVSFIRANSESLRNEISAVKSDVADLGNTVLKHADNQFMFESYKDFYYEADGTDLYVKCTGSWNLRGKVHDTRNYTTILLNHRATSPLGVADCILLSVNYGIAFNTTTSEYDYVYNRTPAENEVIIFMNGGGYISGGIGQQIYNAKRDYLTEQEVKAASDSIASDHAIYEIPAYFEDQLATKLAKIQVDINGGKEDGATQDTEAFIFITDVHWNNNKKHSPALIKRILDSTSISTVICGGDLIYSRNATKAGAVSEIKGFIDPVKACAKEYFGVFGNHDDNSNSGAAAAIRFGKEEQYNLLYPQSNMGNVHWAFEESTDLVRPFRNDYYVDHPHTKTRFLCLDWNYGDLTARKAWVTSVLSKNDGYRVVVIYHGFYANDGEEALAEEHTTFLPTFEPYKNKIVGMFTGHVHFDDVVNYFDNNKAPIIITSCDAFRTAIGMTADTVTEQCFDVVVINYTTSKIHMTRIGFGQDRSVNFSLA